MKTLAEILTLKGRDLETVVDFIQQSVDEQWQQLWEQHLPQLEEVYRKSGDRAYAAFARILFGPIEQELRSEGLICEQSLPGTFPLSREQWGPQDARERRLWTLLRQENGEKLGTLVTRYFHDHTWLHLPQPPEVLGLQETNDFVVAVMVESSRLPGLEGSGTSR